MCSKIVSFIPIKLNNQRLPGKNLMPLGGKPLCGHLFETVEQVQGIDEKYVFCSDEAICPYIPDGLTFMKRDKWLDGPEVKGLEIIGNFVERVDADIYIITHVTSPFMTVGSFEKAIEMMNSGEYDSAFSAEEVKQYCWYERKPINYDPQDIVTTQNVEPIYVENGGYFMFTKEVFKKYHRRIGLKPYMHVTGRFEGVEIDTREDFQYAEAVWNYMQAERGMQK